MRELMNQTTLKEQAADWVVQLELSDGDARTQNAFNAWLAEDPRHADAFAEFRHVWQDMGGIAPHVLAAGSRESPSSRAQSTPCVARSRQSRRAQPLRNAVAAAVCLAMIGVTLTSRDEIQARLLADISTGVGEPRSVTLPDGTHLKLNSGSAVDLVFNDSQRVVRLLKGDAAFEIAGGDNRPFIVEVANATVRDIGTVFQVSLQGAQATVGVTQGLVQVSSAGVKADVSAGEKVRFGRGETPGRQQDFDALSETAWQRGRLVFVNRPLGEVIDELNRHRHGYIKLGDAELANLKVNGVFNTAQPDQALNAVEHSLNLRSRNYSPFLKIISR